MDKNKDYLIIGTDKKGYFRAYAAITSQIAEEARSRHNTSPTATAALGRGLTAGVLMSAGLKGEDLMTIRIIGEGSLGALVVTADAMGNVRGYVQNPEADLPSKEGKLDVGGLVGHEGQLSVTKNLGLKEPYTGSIPLVSGEIGEDIAYYLLKSEQIPSVVNLGVLVDTDISVKASGGFLIQALPGADEDVVAEMEEKMIALPHISELICSGNTPEDIMQKIFGDDFQLLEKREIGFLCGCSKEKLEKILISLGEQEIKDIIEQQNMAEIKCHFCGDEYHFDKVELEAILKEAL